MMTHKEYMEQNRIVENTFDLHHTYYSQFVTDGVKRRVLDAVCIDKLAKDFIEGDKHLNKAYSCSKVWDRVMMVTPPEVASLLKEAGELNTLSNQVCIVKAAARQLIEEHLANQ
ncbi:hypothetical protein HOR53_gp03 [Pectobacterium phage PP99]|uniref:Uncharacterized protein n=1 Tax=Pectobacterium phage PP99 TaxID=1932883 RepID=A0A1P8L614_9CAUD|nr:hypothetical protein HOR53_gp03 [Pectobacterium phage PP99]APW79696.1 hypothetical protein PP99_03 [Pectobacterium phage PP99]